MLRGESPKSHRLNSSVASPRSGAATAERGGWEPLSLKALERRHILQTLEYTSGNRGRAAKLLEINPATLWRKMKSYVIREEA